LSRDGRLRLAMAGLHPDRVRGLVEAYGSADAVVGAIRRGRIEVTRRAAEAVERPSEAIGEVLAGIGVQPIWLGDPGYPEALAVFPDAPDVLFVRGVIPTGPAVAVVGTRRCTTYGRSLARSCGSAIAAAGWVVVSGLARGIDAEAHRGLLDVGGPGVAVLGSGPNVIYPSENRDIHDSLVRGGGAVVTEYPPGTPPEAWRFPPRNRIIAGMSAAVVVIEAAVKGGALITAGAAIDQGKVVLAVPGDIDREASVGCNLLIRDGAVPVLGPGDLIEALSLIVGQPQPRDAVDAEGDRGVLAALGSVGSSLEDLVTVTGLGADEVLVEIAHLEAAGKVVRIGGRVCRRS